MSPLVITRGRVIDPAQEIDRVADVWIEDGRIARIDDGAAAAGPNVRRIDAAGKIVCPGLIDLHVELREPGREEDETIATGTAAALAGGFATVVCHPNTEPPIDTQAQVEFLQHQAARADNCHVYVVACVSKGREGKELAEIGQLVEGGAVAFGDGDAPVWNAELMRRAYQYCSMFDKPIFDHPEARELTTGGVMHDGAVSMVLGLAGMPAAAEDVMTSRDICLAEATGGRLHLVVSTAGSVELVRRAKRRGVRVTCAVCAHHVALTDESLRSFDANYKTNPPLRSAEDVAACVAGLADDTIDAICSQHAPHAAEKKLQELDRAPFGIAGLETALPLAITHLVAKGHLDWPRLVAKFTSSPARILGVPAGTLRVGAQADVTIIDPDVEWTIDVNRFKSKSRNTPFHGLPVRGRTETVIVGGQVKYSRTAKPVA
ncbi:MAG: dihydroorotase [Planctomycetia bacterium]|nr:dihydroorotase [Planctomycetia bacterium]